MAAARVHTLLAELTSLDSFVADSEDKPTAAAVGAVGGAQDEIESTLARASARHRIARQPRDTRQVVGPPTPRTEAT